MKKKMNKLKYLVKPKRIHSWSSKEIRNNFVDYFANGNNHKFIKSSSVVPYCDPTIPFVNAGMIQFKSIFTGVSSPSHKKVVNYQKCIRVGGKHNDLDVVGKDEYHHTFFEMLGNWSFGDYFKKEACEMAWNLITKHYGLPPSCLYVTYFGGDKSLNLEPDLETLEIWEQIGVKKDRIIPSTVANNFWEAGATGPCGPCTEIHIDHTKSSFNRSKDVNKNLPNLTELWNLVFIQYNRNIDGTLTKLPKFHVDTGMGLERLTAILQNKNNNYDTDLFQPLFKVIHNQNKSLPKYKSLFGASDLNGTNSAYRIIADHSRMITACLADSMVPEENYKLRRIIRRAMTLGNKIFSKEPLFLFNVCQKVSETLGDVYPEMAKNINQIRDILNYEYDVMQSLKDDVSTKWMEIVEESPNLNSLDVVESNSLVQTYFEMKHLLVNKQKLSGEFAYYLYNTYGVNEECLSKIAESLNIPFPYENFREKLNDVRMKTKYGRSFDSLHLDIVKLLKSKGISVTDDKYKYSYEAKNGNSQLSYKFENVESAKIVAILANNELIESINNLSNYQILFDKTNFYSTAGGQDSDKGVVYFKNGLKFIVNNVTNYNGYIFHNGVLQLNEDHANETIKSTKSNSKLTSLKNEKTLKANKKNCTSEINNIKIGDICELEIDQKRRLALMQNHTVTHILQASLKSYLNSNIFQKSSQVNEDHLKFTYYSFMNKTDSNNNFVNQIEDIVKNVIDSKVPVTRNVIDSHSLMNNSTITLIPGEIYPETNISVITIKSNNLLSKEACCGTHVCNTKHIKDFAITNYQKQGRSCYQISAVSGDVTQLLHYRSKQFENEINQINEKHQKLLLGNNQDNLNELYNQIRNLINEIKTNENTVSHANKMNYLNKLEEIKNQIKLNQQQNIRSTITEEMQHILNGYETPPKWIVHNFVITKNQKTKIQLDKVTKMCQNIPVLVLAVGDNEVKARCVVPESMINNNFNARIWVEETVAKCFNGKVQAPRGQNEKNVCLMKSTKLNQETNLDDLIKNVEKCAQGFIEKYL